jgi:hypothetical protein
MRIEVAENKRNGEKQGRRKRPGKGLGKEKNGKSEDSVQTDAQRDQFRQIDEQVRKDDAHGKKD